MTTPPSAHIAPGGSASRAFGSVPAEHREGPAMAASASVSAAASVGPHSEHHHADPNSGWGRPPSFTGTAGTGGAGRSEDPNPPSAVSGYSDHPNPNHDISVRDTGRGHHPLHQSPTNNNPPEQTAGSTPHSHNPATRDKIIASADATTTTTTMDSRSSAEHGRSSGDPSTSDRAVGSEHNAPPPVLKEKKSKKEKKPRKKRKAADASLAAAGDVSSGKAARRASPPPSYLDGSSSHHGTDGVPSSEGVVSTGRKPGPKKGKKRKEAKLAKERAKAETAALAAASDRDDPPYVPSSTTSSSRRLPTASSRAAAAAAAAAEGVTSSADVTTSSRYEKEDGRRKKKKHKSRGGDRSSDHHHLHDAAHAAAAAGAGGPFSAAQQAVNEQMRRALEEDQYSALGSVVDTDSSDDDDDGRTITLKGSWSGVGEYRSASGKRGASPPPGSKATTIRLDRNAILSAMRKRLRIEGMRGGGANVIESKGGMRGLDADYDGADVHATGVGSKEMDEDIASARPSGSTGGRGGRKKKRKKGKRGAQASSRSQQIPSSEGAGDIHQAMPTASENDLDRSETESAISNEFEGGADGNAAVNGGGEDDVEGGDEGSIFGQTTGSINATWVECDKCKKWRRLRGVVDDKKLPSKWYCSMNKNDPERAKCTAPEEEYETPNTPESAADARTRKHLRLWVRRLQCNEAYEARLPTMTRGKKRSATTSAKEPYEWVRCCNPSCGKWRAILRFMDARNNVMDQTKNGEWYCVMNTWDEKTASCAAPQENLPAIGCPPWVMQDED